MSRFIRLVAVGLCLGIWSPSTSAADCDVQFDGDDLFETYEKLFLALRGADEEAFMASSAVMATGLECLSEAIQPRMLAAAYRMMGVRQYRMSDNEGAVRWMRTARELDPAFEWDLSTLDLDAPERALYAQQQLYSTVQPVAVPGKVLAKPPGTRILLDGRMVTTPEATGDRFHLVQVVDLKGPVRSNTVIVGNAFPGTLLRAKTQEEVTPQVQVQPVKKGNESRKSQVSSGTVRIERKRPPLKTPILGVGGAGMVGAIVFYAKSSQSKKAFEAAVTEKAMRATRTDTNNFFMGACGLFTVGVATTSLGLYMADGPGLGLAWQW